jgi:hypothetical protein
VAAIVCVLAAPAATAAAHQPAVDQYTTHLPGAGGNSGLASGSAPVAQPGQLPAAVRAALTGSDSQLLTLIATARGLGAPDASRGAATGTGAGALAAAASEGASSSSPSLTTAVADAAGSGPGLALIAVLAGMGIAAAGVRLVRSRRSSI